MLVVVSTPYGDIPVEQVLGDRLAMPRGQAVPGDLLVAALSLTDETFARAVVLMLDHDDDGALGVVLTRPTDLAVESILPAWRPLVTGDPVVHQGGPVSLDSALALASCADVDERDEPVGFRRVVGPLGLVDLDSEPDDLAGRTRAFRVFAGYAGWGPGQLVDEIREGAWYVVPGGADDAFDLEPGSLWARVLRRAGGDALLVSTAPLDPALN